jgi:hypothetical protein
MRLTAPTIRRRVLAKLASIIHVPPHFRGQSGVAVRNKSQLTATHMYVSEPNHLGHRVRCGLSTCLTNRSCKGTIESRGQLQVGCNPSRT